MDVRAYKTPKVVVGDKLFTILDQAIPELPEKSVVVITSKIVSICEGDVIEKNDSVSKKELIKKEADYFIEDETLDKYGLTLTVKDSILIANAGIDESNGNGYFILWPKNLPKVTKEIWIYLKKKFQLRHLGVIISDSRLSPMRFGTLGVGLSWCGFAPLNNYIGKTDIFGRTCLLTKAGVIDGLSAAAVFAMGEGNEQKPIAVITDTDMVYFVDHSPTVKEIKDLQVTFAEDIYAPLIKSKKWKKGNG